MTTVTFDRNENSIEIKGHTLDPVVCHALSALVDSVGIHLENNSGAVVEADDDAYTKIMPPDYDLIDDQKIYNDILDYYKDYLLFLFNAIRMISEENPCNINIIEI